MAMCYVRTPNVHTSFEAKIMLILSSVICSECKAPKNKMKQNHDAGHIISFLQSFRGWTLNPEQK